MTEEMQFNFLPQMYNEVSNHTQLTLLWMFIMWQLVLTSSVGHHPAIVHKMNANRSYLVTENISQVLEIYLYCV